jgi:Uma2 family endonuclease
MAISGRLVTADELFRMPDDGFRYELVRGELRRMTPSGFQHGAVVVNVTVALAQYVRANHLGVVCGAETGFVLGSDPDTVLAPDVAFVRQERIPASGQPVGFWRGAPDLAVEVLSPSDSHREADEKARAWRDAGCRLVLVVSPRAGTVTVYRMGTPESTLAEGASVDAEDVVPGFHLSLADVFAP